MIRSKGAEKESVAKEDVAIEDEVAHQRHIKAMRSEFTKTHPNTAVAAELMKLTFYGRRQEVKSAVAIKEVIERYPFLQNHEEVTK